MPTRLRWFVTSPRRQHQIPSIPFAVGNEVIIPVSSVRDLGINIDSDLSMRTHVSRTVSACFATLRQTRSIRRSVTRSVLQSLVAALTLTRLDFGCTTMAGLPMRQLNRLQTLNAAARLVYSARRREHVSPLLRDLHWLRVPQRIAILSSPTVAWIVQRHGISLAWITACAMADISSRSRLRSASTALLEVPRLKHSTIGDRAAKV